MNSVIRHIEYLISRNDCVIIPGFGAILAHRESASIDAESHIVNAPRRVFSFNSALSHSDGLLACSIARAQGISYQAAIEQIHDDVRAMNLQLHAEGELPLGRIGLLRYSADDESLQFSPFKIDRLSINTSWLRNISTLPDANVVEDEQSINVGGSSSAWARMARLAASIALLICICFVASTPISVNDVDVVLASLKPEIRQVQIEDMLPAEVDEIPTISIYPSQNTQLSIEVPAIVENKQPVNRYCIVVASFATMSDARRYVAEKNNPSLRILKKDDRYRIYAEAFSTEADAYRHLSAKKYSDFGAWVCRL